MTPDETDLESNGKTVKPESDELPERDSETLLLGQMSHPHDGVNWRRFVTNYAALGVLLLLIIVFSVTEPSTFPTVDDLRGIITSQSVLAILALAVMVPLVVGEFDLSIASNFTLTAVLLAELVSHRVPLPLAFLIVLLAGAAVGLVNAFLIVRVGVSSFIATLGVGTVLSGLASWISGNSIIYQGLGGELSTLGNATIVGIPVTAIYVLVLVLLLWYMLQHTPLGRQMYATGYGRNAARLAGIRVERRVVFAFVLGGTIAGVAGIVYTALIGSASALEGSSYLLPAFAAVFLGATTIRAGRFNVWGTVIGVFLLAVGITGLQLAGAQQYIQQIFDGAALIIAVAAARLGARSRQ